MSSYYHRRIPSRSYSKVYNKPLRYMSEPTPSQKTGRTYQISAAFIKKAPDEMPRTDQESLEQTAQNLIDSNYIIPPEKPYYYSFHSKMLRIPIFQANSQRTYITQYDQSNWGINSETLDQFAIDPLFLRAVGALDTEGNKLYPEGYHITISVVSIDFTSTSYTLNLAYCSIQNENGLIPSTTFNGIALSGTDVSLVLGTSGIIGPLTVDSNTEISYKFLNRNPNYQLTYENNTSSWNNSVFKGFNENYIDFFMATNTNVIPFDEETIHPCFSTNTTDENLFLPSVVSDANLYWTIWVDLERD